MGLEDNKDFDRIKEITKIQPSSYINNNGSFVNEDHEEENFHKKYNQYGSFEQRQAYDRGRQRHHGG